jgi:hypothetical protein
LVRERRQRERGLKRFREDFPSGSLVLRFVEAANCSATSARQLSSQPPLEPGTWAVTIRLPRAMEQEFGLHDELLMVCAPSHDVRVDLVDHIPEIAKRSSTLGDLAILVTGDPDIKPKLRDWSPERRTGVLVVPLSLAPMDGSLARGRAPQTLRDTLGKWLFVRNLYDARTPVTGDHFFGRRKELRSLERAILHGRNPGIFGLRKIGKTSLLYALRDRLRKDSHCVSIYVDLQASAPATSAGHVAAKLSTSLDRELQGAALTPVSGEGAPDGRASIIRLCDQLSERWPRMPSVELS